MNFGPEDSKLLHFWQSLHFECETDREDVVGLSSKVDNLRSLMQQIDCLYASSTVTSTSRDDLLHECSEKYRQLVDEQDTTKGLNNFAETVLSLVAGHKNDSQNWRSSLSLDKIKATPTWQDNIAKYRTKDQPRQINIGSSCTRQRERCNDHTKPPQETKKKDWTINMTSSDNHNQTRSMPSSSLMDDCGSNKRKLHFIYPPDQSEKNTGKSSGNPSNMQNPWNAGIPENIHNRVPFAAKDTSNIQQPVKRFSSDENDGSHKTSKFITAKQQYIIDCKAKNQRVDQSNKGASNYGNNARKTLGTRRGPSSKFVPPVPRNSSDEEPMESGGCIRRRNGDNNEQDSGLEPEIDERLKNIEAKMVELIMNEIMDHGPPITWDDIAGLEFAKNVIKEIVVWPMLRPDIFKGLRGPPKGLLLFGPPGTGKTLIGKCIASQSKATFFSISASSLTSKWVGEGEKMVRALFAVARCHLPAVIFIDEIDSLLTQRTDGEHEASRRIKTEFLVQLDGATTNTDERLLVVGATNRPQEIDEAARRRLVKRLYIPLPDAGARRQIICNLLSQQSYSLSDKDIDIIVTHTNGYSGSDMSNLCREAAIGPIRCIASSDIEHITADQVRPIELTDFEAALSQVRASVSDKDLDMYIEWNNMYGSGSK